MTPDIYAAMKGRIYSHVTLCTGRTNQEARAEGFKDVFDLLMSDSDHNRQQLFCISLGVIMPSDKQRRILLDGLAREYCGCQDGWMEYVARECD
jgi:hypothetical protein